MKPITCFLLLAGAAALALAGCGSETASPAFPAPDLADDYRALLEVETFASTCVGIAAAMPQVVPCWREILHDPQAARYFRALADDATPSGQLYALAGLYLTTGTPSSAACGSS